MLAVFGRIIFVFLNCERAFSAKPQTLFKVKEMSVLFFGGVVAQNEAKVESNHDLLNILIYLLN